MSNDERETRVEPQRSLISVAIKVSGKGRTACSHTARSVRDLTSERRDPDKPRCLRPDPWRPGSEIPSGDSIDGGERSVSMIAVLYIHAFELLTGVRGTGVARISKRSLRLSMSSLAFVHPRHRMHGVNRSVPRLSA